MTFDCRANETYSLEITLRRNCLLKQLQAVADCGGPQAGYGERPARHWSSAKRMT